MYNFDDMHNKDSLDREQIAYELESKKGHKLKRLREITIFAFLLVVAVIFLGIGSGQENRPKIPVMSAMQTSVEVQISDQTTRRQMPTRNSSIFDRSDEVVAIRGKPTNRSHNISPLANSGTEIIAKRGDLSHIRNNFNSSKDHEPLGEEFFSPNFEEDAAHLIAPYESVVPSFRPKTLNTQRAEIETADINRDNKCISLVITSLGFDALIDQQIITDLPWQLAIAVAPISSAAERLSSLGREFDHMVLVETPMEPLNYPSVNPGEMTLLTSATPETNIALAATALKNVGQAVGVASYMGARFISEEKSFLPIAAYWQERNLIFFENQPGPRSKARELSRRLGLKYVASDLVLDANSGVNSVVTSLDELAKLAKDRGSATGVAASGSDVLEALKSWLPNIRKENLRLVPLGQSCN